MVFGVETSDVQWAMIVAVCPTISMLVCSGCFFGASVPVHVEATFQNFAAGMILAATALELMPKMESEAP